MASSHVKKGDEVVVIAGTERGKRGKIISVVKGRERLIVEGIKMIKKHVKKNQHHPQGAIIEREGTIHTSNVMLASKFEARASKRGVSADASQG